MAAWKKYFFAAAIVSAAIACNRKAGAQITPALGDSPGSQLVFASGADQDIPVPKPPQPARTPEKRDDITLVEVRTAVPYAIIDLRYATPDNFVKTQLYPSDARCLVSATMTSRLAAAADDLRSKGFTIVFWDAYRPHSAQVKMFNAWPDPAWVAKPKDYSRSHETGTSVDVTLSKNGKYLDMGTGFDDFSPKATAYATEGLTSEQVANRAVLRKAMENAGMTVYSGEWWHFNNPDFNKQVRPPVDLPLN